MLWFDLLEHDLTAQDVVVALRAGPVTFLLTSSVNPSRQPVPPLIQAGRAVLIGAAVAGHLGRLHHSGAPPPHLE
jgi:N-acetylmuramic acid 6-phosphate (MurNAc-6-P) etherase